MAFFKNLLHPLRAQDTSHLTDGEIQLLLRQYQWGSAYVGELPSYFFKIVDATEMRRELGHCDLRVGMNPEIAYSGHVGYRVYRPHRGNHYALKATRLLLHFAYEWGWVSVSSPATRIMLPVVARWRSLVGGLWRRWMCRRTAPATERAIV